MYHTSWDYSQLGPDCRKIDSKDLHVVGHSPLAKAGTESPGEGLCDYLGLGMLLAKLHGPWSLICGWLHRAKSGGSWIARWRGTEDLSTYETSEGGPMKVVHLALFLAEGKYMSASGLRQTRCAERQQHASGRVGWLKIGPVMHVRRSLINRHGGHTTCAYWPLFLS